jgi:rubrerythrin
MKEIVMAIASKAELDALKLAMETERQGYEFFKQARDAAKTEIAAELFDTLMKDELLHEKVIEDYYLRLNEDGTRQDIKEVKAALAESAGQFKTIFSKAMQDPGRYVADLEEDIPNVQLAIDFERNGQNMYKELAEMTEDDRAKTFYLFLEKMESGHEEALDETMRYLQDPNNYLINTEAWTME